MGEGQGFLETCGDTLIWRMFSNLYNMVVKNDVFVTGYLRILKAGVVLDLRFTWLMLIGNGSWCFF